MLAIFVSPSMRKMKDGMSTSLDSLDIDEVRNKAVNTTASVALRVRWADGPTYQKIDF